MTKRYGDNVNEILDGIKGLNRQRRKCPACIECFRIILSGSTSKSRAEGCASFY